MYMDRYYWPIAFAFMGILFGSKGAIVPEALLKRVALGIVVGSVFSVLLVVMAHRNKAKFFINMLIGSVWAFLVFAVGYPNLRRPGYELESAEVVRLAALSLLPLFVFLLISGALLLYRKWAGKKQI